MWIVSGYTPIIKALDSCCIHTHTLFRCCHFIQLEHAVRRARARACMCARVSALVCYPPFSRSPLHDSGRIDPSLRVWHHDWLSAYTLDALFSSLTFTSCCPGPPLTTEADTPPCRRWRLAVAVGTPAHRIACVPTLPSRQRTASSHLHHSCMSTLIIEVLDCFSPSLVALRPGS